MLGFAETGSQPAVDASSSTPAPLAGGFCFGEGPRWFEGLLWFSDMLGEAIHTVTLNGSMTTVPLPGHSPSGLGFRPDGTLLVASAADRQVLCYDGDSVTTLVDLADRVPADLGDMVVDAAGRSYIGSQAPSGGVLVRVDPDASVRIVAEDLDFPNGMVISPDGTTLTVAESMGRRLTRFTIDADGGLQARRTFADGLDGPPDGIALDAAGGVWTAMTLANQFERIVEGGIVTDRIATGGRAAIACALGGRQRRTLFLLTSPSAYPKRLMGTRDSRLDTVTVEIPGAGLP
ncbi:gluconolactonase [Mycolicibacter hiberniae]|uniref:Gluconolactonase n=1 Tax=Mycolicibacter hiberniae TaxID=29314 RepID=A0A7I7X7Y3_9MYCO|nr:gluconolactonase [Mycolicibacter hiberniae]